MRAPRRPVLAALLAAVGLAIVAGGWLVTGWQSTRAEARAIRAEPGRTATRVAQRLTSQLGARLDGILARESARPYFQYRNLYHDPRGASAGQSVVPSPLAAGNPDPFVTTNYQIDVDGSLTIPMVNEEVPELSHAPDLADNRALLEKLRRAANQLGATTRRVARAPVGAQRSQIDRSAYFQNADPNTIYKQTKGNSTLVTPPAATGASPIEIVTGPFQWHTAILEDAPHLVARREVRTPDGVLVQGLILDPAAMATWLRERLPASLGVSLTRDAAKLSVPIRGAGDWRVAIDTAAAIRDARSRADRVERRFWWRLLPASALALVCFGAIVWLVAGAERLARERSRFAAAAAHELRTPLAGLQLYGEMLADGLGDTERASEYALRVSEEAARLGRVVGNVLGFTQLERGTLSVHPRAQDAADAARAAVERARSALEHAGVSIAVDLPETAPARFDDDAVARILQNLLDNAEKHTRGGDDRYVRVSVKAGDQVVIAVSDNGPGVPGRLERRLFRPFERGAGEGEPAGLGLGLAMARALARAQSGDLRYRRTGEGARFELVLPA